MTDEAMRDFVEACGLVGPFLLGVQEPRASSISWRVLDQPFAVVGRNPGSDLFLNDRGVSRRHAYLQLIEGHLFCFDLQSRTGTHWGDEPGLCGWVQPEAGVRIGPFRIRTRDDRPSASPAVKTDSSTLPVPISRSSERTSLPATTLEILGGTVGRSTWRASRALSFIGASRACKVQLQGGDVANFHASLVRTPTGVYVVDLLGPGGILVNGERVRSARIGEDDELSVGAHKIRVRCGPIKCDHNESLTRRSGRSRSGDKTSNTSRLEPGEWKGLPFEGEDNESLVRLMLDEFSRLQQQTADQFQESLMVVLQTFAGVQREQMALLREELGRIRELTSEEQTLRSRVEGRDLAVEGPVVLRLVSGEPGVSTSSPTTGPQSRRPAIKDEAKPAGSQFPGTRTRPIIDPEVESEFHAKLFDRLEEIEGERKGRWHKLKEALLGKGL